MGEELGGREAVRCWVTGQLVSACLSLEAVSRWNDRLRTARRDDKTDASSDKVEGQKHRGTALVQVLHYDEHSILTVTFLCEHIVLFNLCWTITYNSFSVTMHLENKSSYMLNTSGRLTDIFSPITAYTNSYTKYALL